MGEFNKFVDVSKELVNPMRNNMYLPLTVDEGIYLRGALKAAVRSMKQGDEREFCLRVYDRLCDMILDIKSFQNVPF